jgi:hypothetical protein
VLVALYYFISSRREAPRGLTETSSQSMSELMCEYILRHRIRYLFSENWPLCLPLKLVKADRGFIYKDPQRDGQKKKRGARDPLSCHSSVCKQVWGKVYLIRVLVHLSVLINFVSGG